MKYLMMKYALPVAALALLVSCSTDTTAEGPVADPFFSLEDFFNSEVQRLSELQPKVVKTLDIGGNTESHTDLVLDFSTELGAFVNSDINKPSWSDKYRVDSVFSDAGHLGELHYLAKDSSMYTRDIRLTFDPEGALQTCFVRNRLTNFISDFRQNLYYDRETGYRISVYQGFGEDAKAPVELAVTFLK